MAANLHPPSADIMEIRQAKRADGPAAVLGIGTANPANTMPQEEYVDWYFRVTNSDHRTNLKAKMKRICEKSGVTRRHFYHTENMLRDHSEFLDRRLPSLNARQEMLAAALPELAVDAVEDAIAEWGRPPSDITHLVFCTYSDTHMPGADLRLASLLGLRPSVQRTGLYFHGCASFSTALRFAKDIAENNDGARVLVACADLTLSHFRAPETVDTLIAQSVFGDGAGAVIVGAAACEPVEQKLFEMLSASQATIPESHSTAWISESGFVFHPSKEMPALVRQSIGSCVANALAPLGLTGNDSNNWNEKGLFWGVQPSGRAILDSVEEGLELEPKKLAASRRVLGEYGNMSGASMIFVLDELRRRLGDCDDLEPGELGVMLGIGPGISIETMVLRRA